MVKDDHIIFRLREGKGKKALQAGLRNTRQTARSDLLRVGHMMRAYFGPSPHTPMDPMPRGGKDTMVGVDIYDMITRSLY